MIVFLGSGDPNLNLHFHYYWEGGQPKRYICFSLDIPTVNFEGQQDLVMLKLCTGQSKPAVVEMTRGQEDIQWISAFVLFHCSMITSGSK